MSLGQLVIQDIRSTFISKYVATKTPWIMLPREKVTPIYRYIITIKLQKKKKKVFSNFFEDTKNYLCGLFQATPHLSSKRKSVNGRKLRPKSVVDSAEGLSADDIPDLLPSLPTSAEGKKTDEK